MAPVPELEDLIATVDDRSPGRSPIDRLAAATQVSQEVDRLSEDLVGHFVALARRNGASWADIGAVLGVSRQGAHQRHHDRGRPERRWRPAADRWEATARRAVKAAIDAAAQAGNGFVGTEHLLLGLLDVPGSPAAKVLARAGGDADRVRAEVRSRLRAPGDDPGRPVGRGGPKTVAREARGAHRLPRLPFTPLARRTFDLATREALVLGDGRLRCEHLLLGLAAMGEGTAYEALHAAGIDVDRLRAAVTADPTN